MKTKKEVMVRNLLTTLKRYYSGISIEGIVEENLKKELEEFYDECYSPKEQMVAKAEPLGKVVSSADSLTTVPADTKERQIKNELYKGMKDKGGELK